MTVRNGAILGVTENLTPLYQNPSGGAGKFCIVFDDRTLWMFEPRSSKFVGKVQSQTVVLHCGVGFGEDPPFIGVMKDRRVYKVRPLEELRDEGPSCGKLFCFIQSNRARLKTLRDHVVVAFPREHVGI